MTGRQAYLDECVDRRLADRLRARDIVVLTAAEAGALGLDDDAQLLLASDLDLPIVSHNQQHVQRWYERFVANGRHHGGILLVPAGPLTFVELRVVMLLSWMESFDSRHGALFRWHDLQGLMTRGFRLTEFTERDTRRALAIDPL